MNSTHLKILVVITVLFVALALRLPHLAQRPMHTDEAVHAIKFGDLLEHNQYKYDPHEYHGPTLNYFTLIPAWLSGAHTLQDINETTLRIVPLVFGMLLFVLIFLLHPLFSTNALTWMSLWTAISPAFVYYSRYYIMEMLLIVFACAVIVGLARYWLEPRIKWLVLAGIAGGLMMATKETWVINAAALAGASLSVISLHRQIRVHVIQQLKTIPGWHWTLLFSLAIATAGLFFSSFGSNWHGLLDALLTYATYFGRAGGEASVHVHPWYTYFCWLFWYQTGNGPLWTELIIVIGAALAVWRMFSIKHSPTGIFLQLLAIYSLLIIIVYALIPYKTPWNLLNFWQPMIILAGYGCSEITHIKKPIIRWIVTVVIAPGILHLSWQSWQANDTYAASPQNPYVYGHTSTDIFKLVKAVHAATDAANSGDQTYIEVICPNADYWPLPWYLRKYPQVGYWNQVNMHTPAAPIIVAMPSEEPALMKKLYELPPPGKKNLYLPLVDSYLEIRPGVEIRSYVIKALWDRLP